MAKQPGLNLSTLRARLAKGEIAPVYLIGGTEPFLADEAVRSITDAIGARHGPIARTLLHGDEADIKDVLDALRTRDLFNPCRLVVVSPADRFVDRHGAALAAYADAPAPDAYLLLTVTKVDARKKLPKTARKSDGLIACGRVYERDVVPWIAARVRAMDRRIESPAAALLADFLGTDLGAIAGELDKLAIYLGDRKTITAADVNVVALRDRAREVYELTDAIGRRRPADVLAVLDRLLEAGEKAGRILYIVSAHLRRLWGAKELVHRGVPPPVAAHQVGVNYFVEQFIAQAQGFRLAELRRACSALTACEAALKTSAADQRILLETTLLRLVAPPARLTSPA